MRYLAAYLLLVIGGNATPSAEDITNVVTSAGGEADAERIASLLAELEGKDIHELIAAGETKLSSVTAVAAAPAGAAAAPAAAAAAPAAAAKPKVEEVDALDGGMDMFGGSSGGKDY